MKKLFLTLILIFSCAVIGLTYHIYSNQDELIFRSHSLDKEHLFELDHPYEEIFLPTLENTHINGLWFHTENSKGVVLFFHGRGKNLNFWAHRAYPFINRGYDVLIIDYRGFGKSAKGFDESWILEDGETAYHFLLSHYQEKEIIIYGHSMGTSIATWVASTHNPLMLILEAPFYSMIEAASYTKPLIPEFLIRWMLKYHFRTDRWIGKVKAPIYIFHGIPDNVIPYNQSQKLYGEIKHDKKNEMIILPNAGHGDVYQDPLYIEKLDELLP